MTTAARCAAAPCPARAGALSVPDPRSVGKRQGSPHRVVIGRDRPDELAAADVQQLAPGADADATGRVDVVDAPVTLPRGPEQRVDAVELRADPGLRDL